MHRINSLTIYTSIEKTVPSVSRYYFYEHLIDLRKYMYIVNNLNSRNILTSLSFLIFIVHQ